MIQSKLFYVYVPFRFWVTIININILADFFLGQHVHVAVSETTKSRAVAAGGIMSVDDEVSERLSNRQLVNNCSQ